MLRFLPFIIRDDFNTKEEGWEEQVTVKLETQNHKGDMPLLLLWVSHRGVTGIYSLNVDVLTKDYCVRDPNTTSDLNPNT